MTTLPLTVQSDEVLKRCVVTCSLNLSRSPLRYEVKKSANVSANTVAHKMHVFYASISMPTNSGIHS